MRLTFLLASSSEVKLQGVRRYFENVVRPKVTVVPLENTPPTSFIQPRGAKEALICLTERIEAAIATSDSHSYNGILAVENFVYECRDKDVDTNEAGRGVFLDAVALAYYDREYGDIKYRVDLGGGVGIPNSLVPQLHSKEPMTTTVGHLLFPLLGHLPAYKHDDWYVAVGEDYSRSEAIDSAIESADFKY